jgi:hypothetical protein
VALLLRSVYSALRCHTRIQSELTKYIKSSDMPYIVFTEDSKLFSRRQRSNTPSEPDLQAHACFFVGRILRHWFNAPLSFMALARHEFIAVIMKQLGNGALFLRPIWELYNSLPRWLFTNPPWNYHGQQDCPFSFEPYMLELFAVFLQGWTTRITWMKSKIDTLDQRYTSFVRLATKFVKDPSCFLAFEHKFNHSGVFQYDVCLQQLMYAQMMICLHKRNHASKVPSHLLMKPCHTPISQISQPRSCSGAVRLCGLFLTRTVP